MRKRTKARLLHRLGAWALALCLVAGLLPGTAFAAGTDTGKAIQLVDSGTAANISGAQADNIYFGIYQQSSDGNGSYNIDPIKWRVLANNEKNSGTLFLLSDQNLDVLEYMAGFATARWYQSSIRSWLNGYGASENYYKTDYSSDNFIDTAFSSGEQSAIRETYVYNKTQSDGKKNPNTQYTTPGGNNTTDRIFLLSVEEGLNKSYFPNLSTSRISTDTAYVAGGGKANSSMSRVVGEADFWWLRTPGRNSSNVAYVDKFGYLNYAGNNAFMPRETVRPAFHLNLNSVLFTSAAEGGKSATGMGSGLAAVNDYTGNEWKLTLLDSSRNSFTASTTTSTIGTGQSISVAYSGAQTGSNEYVSAMLVDGSGSVLCYGRVAQGSASGTASITIPDGLAPGSYTLKVFSEQYNGDKMTDYASAFQDIALTVTEAGPAVTDVTVSPARVTVKKGDTQQFTATVTGEEGCDQTVTWITDGAKSSGTTISTDGLLTVAANETASAFYVAAVSKADNEIYGVAFVVVDPHPHNFEQVVRESALKSPATCTEAAVYYYSCYLCGELDKSQ